MQVRLRLNYVYSFAYDFVVEDDTTSFAYCIPYTYSHLNKFIQDCKIKYSGWMKSLVLCKSLSGLNLPLLIISDESYDQYLKSLIVICARVHPGESNSSHIIEGLVKYICGDDETVRELRKKVVFKIIPMLNPDGVVAGNYRTSFFGKDLNEFVK
jgi:murein tripeptide amidase MpaA